MKQTLARNVIRAQKLYSLNNTDMSYVLDISRRTLGRIKEQADFPTSYCPLDSTIEKVADAFNVAPNEVTQRLPAATIASVL